MWDTFAPNSMKSFIFFLIFGTAEKTHILKEIQYLQCKSVPRLIDSVVYLSMGYRQGVPQSLIFHGEYYELFNEQSDCHWERWSGP